MHASLFDTYNFFQCKTSEKLQQRKYKIKDSYIGTYIYIHTETQSQAQTNTDEIKRIITINERTKTNYVYM